jgi:hypothetical protein
LLIFCFIHPAVAAPHILYHQLKERKIVLADDGTIIGTDTFFSRITCTASGAPWIIFPKSTGITEITNTWEEFKCSGDETQNVQVKTIDAFPPPCCDGTVHYGYQFSTSIKGFQNYFADEFVITDSVPVQNVRYQLRLPVAQKIHWTFQGRGHLETEPADNDPQREYQWHFSSVSPDSKPASLFIAVEMSWEEIASRYAQLWNNQCENFIPPSPDEIGITSREPDAIFQDLLAYIKDNFQYQAVYENDHWRLPAPCQVVWDRQWGDCKDLTLVISKILNTWGMKTTPVLVGKARNDKGFADPFIFFHVVLGGLNDKSDDLYDIFPGRFIIHNLKFIYLLLN